MKRCLIFVSILALAACTTDSGSGGGGNGGSYNHSVIGNGTSSGSMTGGSGTGSNTGGNTNSGNTNNQQNNQVVHYTNFKQYFDNVLKNNPAYSDFVENTQNWPAQGGYKHYEYKGHTSTGTNHTITHYFYNEKELQLANYGVSNTLTHTEFEPDFANNSRSTAYVHNREGVGNNVYTPQENTVFQGGTLAYLDSTEPHNDILLKGNATFTYNSTNPTLHLDYDNYYSFDMSESGTGTSTTVTASGTNNTGDSYYDVPTITKNCSKAYAYYDAEYLQKGNVQEAAGTYQITFGKTNGYHFGDAETNDFYLRGAFGGTKQ